MIVIKNKEVQWSTPYGVDPEYHTSLVWSSNVHCKEEDTSLALKRTVLESCYKICVRQKGPQGALVWPSNKLKYYVYNL